MPGASPAPVLAHERVTDSDADPRGWIFFLHGIFGAGRNWRTVAGGLVRRRPEWGAVLVDLRCHGGSLGFSPPHTIEACASDLANLARVLGEDPLAVAGHSFGGKVALAYAAGATALRQVWVIDSDPGARPPSGSAVEMLERIRRLPPTFRSREEGVRALEDAGLDAFVARWMATNLAPVEGGVAWRFDPEEMEALLASFFRTDLWPVVEREGGPERIFLKASESGVLDPAASARLEKLSRESLRVTFWEVRGGHWLNADAPQELVSLLVEELPPV